LVRRQGRRYELLRSRKTKLTVWLSPLW